MTATGLPRTYAVSRISKVERAKDGTVTSTLLAEPKRRRVSKRYKKADRLLRRLARAQQVTANEFLERHERSTAKKKNGGVKKFAKNAVKAARKGGKKLRVR